MAGRLPGVGLPPRKGSQHHHRNHQHHAHAHAHAHASATYRDLYQRELLEEESVSALDETALKARQRLQKKLGHFLPSNSGPSENAKKEGKVCQSMFKEAGLGRKLLESSWLLRSNRNRHKKERKVCAVCLEDFQQEQKVMNLSCSHKYHSACLLPWLATHLHCPYCRTPVESS